GTITLQGLNWYYLELRAVIHDTAGVYEERGDGLTDLLATGVDTRDGGTAGQWNCVGINGAYSSYFYADDFYVCDGSGTRNNTFLGSVLSETLWPQTGAVAPGSNTGLTPSTGTDHGALVDENPPNTTDFNYSATVGAKDTYNYPAVTLPGAILGVQTNLYVAKSDAAARTVCAVVRTGDTDDEGVPVSPLTSYGYFWETREVNPATGLPWTTAEVNAIEAGMKVTS